MDDDQGGYRQINKSLNIGAFGDYLKSQIKNLPRIPNVEQVTPRVLRILGQNPGKMTLQGTNTYVIGTGKHRLMIDTSGGEPEWASLVESTLQQRGITLDHVLLTHWHGDHTGGVPDLLRLYPNLAGHVHKNLPVLEQEDIDDGQIWEVEGATIRALHAPGHSEDHMCFILEEENAMFTGDNILGHGSSALEDLGIFQQSLQKMYDEQCEKGYSAHGVTIQDLSDKIMREMEQKWRRERQVLDALRKSRNKGAKNVTLEQIVGEIYGSALDKQTRSLTLEPIIDEVLRKLAGDGSVAFANRGGKRRWYAIGAAHNVMHIQEKLSSVITVEEIELSD